MLIYRISTKSRANDLSGIGAKLYGGRWNSVGLPVVYGSSSISLAMLEILSQAKSNLLNAEFVAADIDLPSTCSLQKISIDDLPDNWNYFPHPLETQLLGDNWLKNGTSLILTIPSAANLYESNYLLNPLHPEMKNVSINKILPIQFNPRIAKISI